VGRRGQARTGALKGPRRADRHTPRCDGSGGGLLAYPRAKRKSVRDGSPEGRRRYAAPFTTARPRSHGNAVQNQGNSHLSLLNESHLWSTNDDLALVFGAVAAGGTWQARAGCSGEANVSFERYGPHGSIADVRPDASEVKVAVTLALNGSCWAAGSFYLTGGKGARSRLLPSGLKTLGFEERGRLMRTSCKNVPTRRAVARVAFGLS
jgi:hypothetical protein